MNQPPEFNIQGRKVGLAYPPLIIAEIGINHEGSLNTALAMVDSAIAAGAEVIKHQTHIVDDEMSQEASHIIPGNADVSIHEIMARCALSEADEIQLKEYVEGQGAIFISTPFSRAAVHRLEKMNVKAYKIGSGECNNYPLIELIASFKKPIILSTGMNDIESIKQAVAIIKRHQAPFCLLHTTNLYPTPDHLVRFGAMQQLQQTFPDAVVGLSDHTLDNLACLGAVALGASVLERHFTDSKDRPGPDICCSMTGPECHELIQQSKRMALMRGGEKIPAPEEQVTIDFAYASVVSTRDIEQGELLTADNLWVKRPGTGDFLAKDYAALLGQIAAQPIAANVQIKQSDIE